MLDCKKLAVLAMILSLMAPLEARTRKGDRLLAQGRTAEVRKQYDQALDLYEQALSDDPADAAYQLAMRRARFQAGQFHVERGLKLRGDGKTAEALAEFEKAYAIDPASSIAEQEIRRTRSIIERDKKAALGPDSAEKAEERGLTPIEVARKDSQERMDRVLGVPELKPLSAQPINFKMNNVAPKTAFETLGKVAGINVIFDPDIQAGGKNFNIEFNNETLEASLDNLAVLTRYFWKPLSANTIFVTMDTTTKRRDYEEQVVKVFYLKNVASGPELNEISVNIRTICAIQRAFPYPAQMAIVVRAEADKVALAEKLIADLDKPKSEVVIDVLVLETNRSKDRDLAFGLSDGINAPITYNGTATGEGDKAVAALPLNRLSHISSGQYSVVLPNASLQATLSDRTTRVMQSPQVRAGNGQKASLRIGDKVPTASGSFQPGIGGVGINPLVNTQFQYLEVGVNVDITPNIHGTDEVSLHVEMDVSQVRDHVDLGGISQPVIGQRKVTFDTRMREGEANVLGGLMQTQTGKTVSGVPGLARIPILGKLFSGESTTNSESELLFVLIPHIVRAQDLTASNLKGIATGNDTTVKLSYGPKATSLAQPMPPAAAATPATPPATTAPVTAPPATAPPVTNPTATAPPATAPPMPLFPPVTAPPPGVQLPGVPTPARVTFAPARVEGQLGSTISVTLMVENATDLFATPFRINFDPKIVRLNDVSPGALLTSDGKQILPPTKNILNDTGDASVSLTRVPGSGGVSGSGALVTFTFQAMARGTTMVTLPDLALRNSQLNQIPAASNQLAITVR